MKLDIYLVVFCILSILLNVAFFFYQKSLEVDIGIYKSEILELKIDSEQAAKQAASALITAQQQMKQIQKKSDAILKQKVSDDCAKSMAWLRDQAKLL